jgi:hypothetical protein
MSHPRRLRAVNLPWLQTRQRKPSSFGSNVQRLPEGIVPARASIGSGSGRATAEAYAGEGRSETVA